MKEENVTKEIIKYLQKNNWEIIAFDFPQSGTGIMILPDDNKSSKNKNSIIPDIIAYKEEISVFFENKDRLVKSDFYKINDLRIGNKYINNIYKLLSNYKVKKIYYGVGIPEKVKSNKLLEYSELVDFILKVSENGEIIKVKDKFNIF